MGVPSRSKPTPSATMISPSFNPSFTIYSCPPFTRVTLTGADCALPSTTLYTYVISLISKVVDRNTGTASLRAVFPNKNGLLYSGTSGNVILPVTMKGSLVIPQATTFEIQDIVRRAK